MNGPYSRMIDRPPPKTLQEIVDRQDVRALEAVCLRMKYHALREKAEREGVDLGLLEELLARI